MESSDNHNTNFTIWGTQDTTSQSNSSPEAKIDRLRQWQNSFLVTTEEFEIEFEDESKMLAHMHSWENQKLWAKDHNELLSYWILLQEFQNFNWDLAGKN